LIDEVWVKDWGILELGDWEIIPVLSSGQF